MYYHQEMGVDPESTNSCQSLMTSYVGTLVPVIHELMHRTVANPSNRPDFDVVFDSIDFAKVYER